MHRGVKLQLEFNLAIYLDPRPYPHMHAQEENQVIDTKVCPTLQHLRHSVASDLLCRGSSYTNSWHKYYI